MLGISFNEISFNYRVVAVCRFRIISLFFKKGFEVIGIDNNERRFFW